MIGPVPCVSWSVGPPPPRAGAGNFVVGGLTAFSVLPETALAFGGAEGFAVELARFAAADFLPAAMRAEKSDAPPREASLLTTWLIRF